MGLLILCGVTLGWIFLAYHLAGLVFENSGKLRDLFTLVLSFAPFAYDTYVYFGFSAYCDANAGIVQLEPIETDALAFDDVPGASEWGLLMHPALRHVQYVGSQRPQPVPPVSLLSTPSACQSELHQGRIKSKFQEVVAFTRQVEEMGYCYSNDPLPEKARYLLARGDGDGQYRNADSIYYFRKVRTNASMRLIDLADGSVKSQFVQLSTPPGFLTELILPEIGDTYCPEIRHSRRGTHFPFGDELYIFLEKAIVEKS